MTIIDTNNEWKETQTRNELLRPAHGGKSPEGSPHRVISWLLWVRQLKTWSEAETYCREQKGILFWKVDGTKEQLDFLSDKLGEARFFSVISLNIQIT